MMGSGKSTLGRELAVRTGWRHLDNDALVLAATGRAAADLEADGEPTVRDAEARALRAGLAEPPPVILGVAAGVVLDAGNRRALGGAGVVVWLRAAPSVLAERVRGTHRAWLHEDPAAWLRRTLAARAGLYAEVADLVLDADAATPAELADRVLLRLREVGCLPSA